MEHAPTRAEALSEKEESEQRLLRSVQVKFGLARRVSGIEAPTKIRGRVHGMGTTLQITKERRGTDDSYLLDARADDGTRETPVTVSGPESPVDQKGKVTVVGEYGDDLEHVESLVDGLRITVNHTPDVIE